MIKQLLYKVEWRLLWKIIYPTIWMSKKVNLSKTHHKQITIPFSIGMVTYVARFDIFKKNFDQLYKNFPDVQTIICVNGYYDIKRQNEYLIKITDFLKKYKNVKIIPYIEPQSISKLWNQFVIHSVHEKIFIFNDDVEFSPYFRNNLLDTSFFNYEICTINGSWSHFLISKSIIKKIGWFEERLFGVGGEDWDYLARLTFADIQLELVNSKDILNTCIMTKDFSYGKNIEVVAEKYSKSCTDFLFSKWEITTKEDKEAKYIWDRYIKPVKGMETPNFYPDYFSK